MSYFALLIKYKNGGYAIPLKTYFTYVTAKRSAALRLKRNKRIEQILIIEQPSIFDVCDIDVKQYV